MHENRKNLSKSKNFTKNNDNNKNFFEAHFNINKKI